MKIVRLRPHGSEDISETQLRSALTSKKGVLWVDMTGPTEEDLQVMRDVFSFHPLAIEDTRNQMQRPKIEQYGDHLFAVLNPASFGEDSLAFRELDVFVGRNYVVTVHRNTESVIDEARKRIDHSHSAKMVSSGYVLYVLMDVVEDSYFSILDAVGGKIEKTENLLLKNPSRQSLKDIYQLRRTLLSFQQMIRSQRDMFNVLADALLGHELVFTDQKALDYYLRDVKDHVSKIADIADGHANSLRNAVDLYMSATSSRLNQIVNRLTIITIIVGMVGVISGFYGMNFEATWPPFSTTWGLAWALGLMAFLTGLVLVAFRKAGWF